MLAIFVGYLKDLTIIWYPAVSNVQWYYDWDVSI